MSGQFDFTSEIRFRSGAERNIEQQIVDTTLCHCGSNVISDGLQKLEYIIKWIRWFVKNRYLK
jgi:hypothetical protein